MQSTSAREVQVPIKAEAVVEAVEAKAKARVSIDLNQKADHQVTVPIVVRGTLPRGARHLVRNATIATRKVTFHSTAGLSIVTFPIPIKIQWFKTITP